MARFCECGSGHSVFLNVWEFRGKDTSFMNLLRLLLSAAAFTDSGLKLFLAHSCTI